MGDLALQLLKNSGTVPLRKRTEKKEPTKKTKKTKKRGSPHKVEECTSYA